MTRTNNRRVAGQNARGLLKSLPGAKTRVRFDPLETIFAQGDRCAAVMYIERGRVKLTVTSPEGKVAIVAILPAGAFFGEGALAGQRHRKATATAMIGSTIAIVKTAAMRRRLHTDTALSDWFRSHMLARNARIEADLVGHHFNGCEKRLARSLLLLSHFDDHQSTRYELPKISRSLLAEMSGTTRSRVDFFMNKFRKLGFLERRSERNGGVQVHCSMLSVVLRN